jgi:membrane protease YdiL (CAAX protease family)
LRLWSGSGGEEHSLVLLAQQPLNGVERGLWLFGVLLYASVLEELLFRGLLLTWCAGRRWGGWVALAAALVVAVLRHLDQLSAALRDPAELPAALLPAGCVLALAPVLWLVQKSGRWKDGPAILGAAALFGFVHGAWPSPLPLLALGVGLGVLARRSGSLAGPILLHALFNGVTAVQVMWLG